MRSSTALFLALALCSCGTSETPAPEPAAPSPEPAVEPAPAPEPPPPAIPPNDVRTLGEPSVYTTDVGGLVRHGELLVRYGDGEPAVLGRADGRCSVALEESRNILPAGSWSHLTVTATPTTPDDAAFCARFGGTFGNGHPSDPRAGGPPPPPTFPGSECWLLPQVTSATDLACATLAAVGDPYAPTAFTATSYVGDCCVGTAGATFEIPGTSQGFLMTDDGAVLVALVRGSFIEAAEVAGDPVVFVVARASGRRELHLAELLAGDPILTQGVSFGLHARLDGTDLLVRAIGGDEHRVAL